VATSLNRVSRTGVAPSHGQSLPSSAGCFQSSIMSQGLFRRMLELEQKRTGRTQGRFAVLLLASGAANGETSEEAILTRIPEALWSLARGTDIIGWYKTSSVIGVIFTEIGAAEETSVERALLEKVSKALKRSLSNQQIDDMKLFFQVYPRASGEKFAEDGIVLTKYRDFPGRERQRTTISLKDALNFTVAK